MGLDGIPSWENKAMLQQPLLKAHLGLGRGLLGPALHPPAKAASPVIQDGQPPHTKPP